MSLWNRNREEETRRYPRWTKATKEPEKENKPMKLTRSAAIFPLVAAGLLTAVSPQARADAWNQRTTFTFSGPVEVPGMVLPAGTYVFKLADSESDRDIVQIFNKRENHIYGTYITIPDYRLKPTGKTILTFEERAAGAPEAVRAWFYPGDLYGHEFVYPKVKALALAKASNQPVPAVENEVAVNMKAKSMTEPAVAALKTAPMKAEKPTQEEVVVGEVFEAPPPGQRQMAQAAPPASTPPTLPPTGSDLPLIGLLGLLCLAAAFSLRRALAKTK